MILEKVIQKAIDGGWEEGAQVLEVLTDEPPTDKQFMLIARATIFNHDFAKALWGTEGVVTNCYLAETDTTYLPLKMSAWRYHLQQMVAAEDPLQYLGAYLNG